MDTHNELSEFESLNAELTNTSISYLKESAKWGRFLSILGFILSGLMILASLFMMTAFSSFPGGADFGPMGALPGVAMGLIYILIALLYLLPSLFLFRFSKNTLQAINSSNSSQITTAFKNLKSMFKFMGIAAILFIGLYVIGIIVAIGVAATQGFS